MIFTAIWIYVAGGVLTAVITLVCTAEPESPLGLGAYTYICIRTGAIWPVLVVMIVAYTVNMLARGIHSQIQMRTVTNYGCPTECGRCKVLLKNKARYCHKCGAKRDR